MPSRPVRPANEDRRGAPLAGVAATLLAVVLPLVVAVAVGCSGKPAPTTAAKTGSHDDDHEHGDDHDDHEHDDDHGHEHPTTLAGAVEAIGSRLASLEKVFTGKEFADKHLDEADSLVHEIGHLLEDGDELLEKVPEAVAAKARDAWNELDDCLGDLDEKLHAAGDDKKKAVKEAYEAVKARIGSAMESLRSHAKSAGKPVEK